MRAQKSSIVCWAPKRPRSAAYCRWEARTALRATEEIYARHMLAVGPLKKHCKRLPGFANWLSIETGQLNRHRYPEILQLAQRRTEMVLEAPLGVLR